MRIDGEGQINSYPIYILPIIVIIIYSFYLSPSCIAQPSIPVERSIRFSGQFHAELIYDDITGKNQKRPEWVRSSYLSGELSIPGLPPVDLRLRLSSLEKSIRQYFNRFSVKTGNNWIDIGLGDVYPDYSKYTLNGIMVRGGEIDLHPGRFLLATTYGRTRRAIEQSIGGTASFKQTLYGFKIGYGEKKGSSAHLNWVKIKDDASSLASTGNLKPEENLLVGINARHTMFNKKLIMIGEFTGSAFSRDLNSAEIDISGDAPEFITNFYTPRISSQYDLATRLESRLSSGDGNGRVVFANIGPGFRSLGTSYIHNDIRKINTSWDHRFARGKFILKLGYDLSRDNLNGQKRTTTNTNSGLINMHFTVRNKPSLNLSYRFYKLSNNDDSSFAVDNLNHLLGMTISNKIKMLGKSHNIKLGYSISIFNDRRTSIDIPTDYNFHRISFASSTQLDIPVKLIAGIGWSSRSYESDVGKEARWSYRLAAVHKALQNNLTTRVYFHYNSGDISGSFQDDKSSKKTYGFKAIYRHNKTSLNLRIEIVNFGKEISIDDDYDEFLIRLTFEQSFGGGKNL